MRQVKIALWVLAALIGIPLLVALLLPPGKTSNENAVTVLPNLPQMLGIPALVAVLIWGLLRWPRKARQGMEVIQSQHRNPEPSPSEGMEVRYTPTRTEIRRAFMLALRLSLRFRTFYLLFWLWPPVFVLAIRLLSGVPLTSRALGVSLLFYIGCLAFAPIAMVLRTKKSQRCLRITPAAILTTVGKLSGRIPWAKVDRVHPAGDLLLILGRGPHLFAIPGRAFSSDDQRAEFTLLCGRYLAGSEDERRLAT